MHARGLQHKQGSDVQDLVTHSTSKKKKKKKKKTRFGVLYALPKPMGTSTARSTTLRAFSLLGSASTIADGVRTYFLKCFDTVTTADIILLLYAIIAIHDNY